jgi:hypothetical protein
MLTVTKSKRLTFNQAAEILNQFIERESDDNKVVPDEQMYRLRVIMEACKNQQD